MTDPTTAAREMVASQLQARGIEDPRVLDAMQHVPRHAFIPERDIDSAYADHALPTAQGQTISQPYIVARMTELLDVQPNHRVLEVGTGSGYQTAVLAALGAHIVTIERHAELADHARRVLQQIMPDAPITIVLGDGSAGYPNAAPYDRILVTAGAPTVPEPLREQLADGGRMVIPLGDPHQQQLMLIERQGEQYREIADLPCRFVPLVGEHAWKHGG